MDMDERKLRILRAIIDDYIMTAMPVGSRTISKKYDVGGLSSATIRNEMSDLEALGYLDQPHTSAGRVPSAKAYRLYVEMLLRGTPTIQPEEAAKLRGHFDTRLQQVQDVIQNAALAVAEATNYTTVVVSPQGTQLRIRHVQLVPVSEGAALLIVVTDGGVFKDTVIHVDQSLNMDHLHMISKMLSAHLAGRPIGDIRNVVSAMAHTVREHASLMMGVLEAFERFDSDAMGGRQMAIGGSGNILHYPEYSDVEKARAFLSVLETRDKLRTLLASSQQMEFTIRIGSETGMPEMEDCSVVTATYHVGSDRTGTIGVIGPTRMHYAKVLSVLDYMGKSLSELLRGE